MLEPSWTGRRVSVRRVIDRDPSGRLVLGDVVGDLLSLDAQHAVVESRTGPVEIPVPLVTAARLAAPSTADELALEAVVARGWRAAETEQLGGWLLRADHGFTRRANSVLPLRPPGPPLDDALARARDWYAERHLPLTIAIPNEARRLLGAALAERGWAVNTESHVMTTRLDMLAMTDAPEVGLEPQPSDAWRALYRGGEGLSATGQALLTRHEQVVFAAVGTGSDALATGRGVVDDGWLGVSGVEVAPEARRRGLATRIMRALWSWGRAHGATRGYLQVEIANAAAIALYEGLGYRVHHDYHYCVAP